jgi:hypothetical protein
MTEQIGDESRATANALADQREFVRKEWEEAISESANQHKKQSAEKRRIRRE